MEGGHQGQASAGCKARAGAAVKLLLAGPPTPCALAASSPTPPFPTRRPGPHPTPTHATTHARTCTHTHRHGIAHGIVTSHHLLHSAWPIHVLARRAQCYVPAHTCLTGALLPPSVVIAIMSSWPAPPPPTHTRARTHTSTGPSPFAVSPSAASDGDNCRDPHPPPPHPQSPDRQLANHHRRLQLIRPIRQLNTELGHCDRAPLRTRARCW